MDNIEIDDINIEFHIASKQEAEKSSAFLLDEKEMIEVKDEEKTYYINSSLIKKFLKKGTEIDYCAAKVYALYIAKTHKSLPTESMLKGLFFETGCIGATQNGEGVYDLPRNKKTGAKSIDQIRLEQQIQVFKSMYKEHDIRIEKDNIQLKLGKPFGYVNGVNVIIVGTLDIVSPIKFNRTKDEIVSHKLAVIDLKSTKNRHSTFGEYCWGDPQRMDHIQAVIYHWITSYPFVYLVFDYNNAETMGYDFIPVNVTADMLMEFKESVRKVVGIMGIEEAYDWKRTNNLNHLCKDCPIIECKSRNLIKEI